MPGEKGARINRGFDVVLAERLGLTRAIIIAQIDYWLERSKNIRNGRTWVYNTYNEWNRQLPMFGNSTIRQAINDLEDLGVLISGNFNTSGYIRTKWYTIEYGHKLIEGSLISSNSDVSMLQDLADPSAESQQVHLPDSGISICRSTANEYKTKTTQESTRQKTTHSELEGTSSKYLVDLKWFENLEEWQKDIVTDYVENVMSDSKSKIRKPEYYRLGVIRQIREGKTSVDLDTVKDLAVEMFGRENVALT